MSRQHFAQRQLAYHWYLPDACTGWLVAAYPRCPAFVWGISRHYPTASRAVPAGSTPAALDWWLGTGSKNSAGFADRGSILLIIYVAFSKGMTNHIWRQIDLQDFLKLSMVLVVLLALALVVTTRIARWVLRLRVLPLVLSHQLQLIVCPVLAKRYFARSTTRTSMTVQQP